MDATSDRSGLRRNRNWQRLWLGQAISITGDYVFAITLVLWIGTQIARGMPWAPVAVSSVLIAAAVPALAVGPFAGVFVDRWNRRRTMLTADASRTILVAALLVLTVPSVSHALSAVARIAVIDAVVVAAGCFSQFFNPSRFAMIGAVVTEEDRARASGLFQATSSGAAIIGPPLAAPLLFAFGVQWALIINAVSFAISFLTIWTVRLHGDEAEPATSSASGFLREFRAGFRFFARSPVLKTLTIGVTVATLGAGALNALNVFFVVHNLHVPARWLGTLTAAEGAGAVAGALAAGWIAGKIGSARVFLAGLFLGGVAVIGYSRTTLLPVAMGVVACTGLVVGAVNTVITPLLLGATPQHLLGRVIAVINPVQQLAAISSMAVAGFLASTVLRGFHLVVAGITFGPYDTILAASGLLFIAASIASIAPMRAVAVTERASDTPADPLPPMSAEPEADPAGG